MLYKQTFNYRGIAKINGHYDR